MIAMEASALIDSPAAGDEEASAILEWRCSELRRAGYGFEDALFLAISPHVDLHQATDLLGRGCPTGLALRILL
jgi:hypothetical protein